MGCLCAKPTPPPDRSMEGVWCYPATAHQINAGYGKFRYKRVKFLPGLGLRGIPSESEGRPAVKLEISPSGNISFVSVASNGYTVLIDMPVTNWEGGQMEFPCGGPPLSFEFDGKNIVITSGGERVVLQRRVSV